MDASGDRASLRRPSPMASVRTVVFTAVMVTAPATVVAQSKLEPAGFDVVSIRPSLSGANGSSISRSGGRVTLENVSLRECISFAYGIATGRDYELSGPDWLESEKFDIVATFPAETSRDRVREMLRKALGERFGLKTHNENRELESYVLVVGKRGDKLPVVSTASDGAFVWGEGKLTARAISMSGLAERLSGPVFKLGRPVVDMTGIKGSYDFVLSWAPDDAPADGRASIFTALLEQLGLKLESRRVMFRILVVDRAEKVPTEN